MAEIDKNPAKTFIQNSMGLPSENSEEEIYNQISIIKGLSVNNDLHKIELRLKGYSFDFFKNKWVQSRSPLMNSEGIGNFMACLGAVGDNVNFSNMDEKVIPRITDFLIKQNYPHFKIYADDFELKQQDENTILTIMFSYFYSILRNAKGAGHRNVVRGTLSESVLLRGLERENDKKKKGFFSNIFKGGRN